MATYKCNMSINRTFGQCDENLVYNNLELDNGLNVQFSKCPNGHAKSSLHYVIVRI